LIRTFQVDSNIEQKKRYFCFNFVVAMGVYQNRFIPSPVYIFKTQIK
jgi:hypothetical protein